MILICAWCKETLGEKDPFNNKSVTHEICPTCAKEMKKKYTIIEILELKNPELKKKKVAPR